MLERRGTSPICQQEAVERRREPCMRRMEAVDEVPRQRGESGGKINGGALAGEEKQGRAWRRGVARGGRASKGSRSGVRGSAGRSVEV